MIIESIHIDLAIAGWLDAHSGRKPLADKIAAMLGIE
jgi:hypothetical protein